MTKTAAPSNLQDQGPSFLFETSVTASTEGFPSSTFQLAFHIRQHCPGNLSLSIVEAGTDIVD